jgi:hypothetical protein
MAGKFSTLHTGLGNMAQGDAAHRQFLGHGAGQGRVGQPLIVIAGDPDDLGPPRQSIQHIRRPRSSRIGPAESWKLSPSA